MFVEAQTPKKCRPWGQRAAGQTVSSVHPSFKEQSRRMLLRLGPRQLVPASWSPPVGPRQLVPASPRVHVKGASCCVEMEGCPASAAHAVAG